MRRHLAARRPGGLVAIALGTAAALVAAGAVTASSAAWTDVEHDHAAVGALDCAADPVDVLDTRAWGRILAGSLLGIDLDTVAAVDGVTVDNLDPALASTGTSVAGAVTDLGDDAWSAALNLSLLGSLSLGAGVELPLDAGTGVYDQYGRATSGGAMTGASGAVSAAGGVASLDTPTSETPRLGTLRLSTVLDSVLPGVGVPAGRLADVALEVGAIGAITELDGCDARWDAAGAEARVARDYLVAGLGLGFTSDLVAGLGTTLDDTLGTLQGTLNGLLAPGTSVTGSALTGLTGLLGDVVDGVPGVALGDAPVTATIGATVDLTPVRALLTTDLTDGVVTVNLASGRVSADLAALVGEAYEDGDGLDGRDPNTSVLTPEVLDALLARTGMVISSFVAGPVQDAVMTAISDTTLTVSLHTALDATVNLGITTLTVPEIVGVDSTFSGRIGSFLGQPDYPAPTASTSIGILPGAPGVAVAALNLLLGSITTPLVSGIATSLLPSVGSLVVSPLVATLSSTVATTLGTVVGEAVPDLVDALRPMLDVLATVLRLTLNARPDEPGGVGPPADDPGGRYFETALHVGVVNAAEQHVLSLFLASASVGPDAAR